MPVKHIKKIVGSVAGKQDMRLVGIAVVVIVIIAIALLMMQGQGQQVAATPTPVVTPTQVATVAATPTAIAATPSPTAYVPSVGGAVTEKPHCTDGTPEGQCNAISYMYCRQAPVGLSVDCTKCGCPSGMTCNSDTRTCRS